jgi:hypothetical protein
MRPCCSVDHNFLDRCERRLESVNRRGKSDLSLHFPPLKRSAYGCFDQCNASELGTARSEQGNRMKDSSGTEGCKEVVIPSGGLAPGAE